ncbi:glycoside hydrolase N-terminal domain-containing protein [uncultured Eubacterium sp.]|uniref:glycoside hydrolase family 95 protein n=1 Tax=uncultured Eubacterium sp. TaxID=165185 RepID=UPI0015B9BF97|nr:glycoside hydrolase family 95 protein [uncultured Eubacterium sp.]
MKNLLFYKKKAKAWEEALPVGNGRIGAMVFGNLKTERIALNEDSLWSGYPKDLNKKDAVEYLEPLRQAIFDGDHKKAREIANRDFHGHWSEAYLPFGDLIIEYSKSSKKGYIRTLDISTGVSVTKSDLLTQTVFVSYPAQLAVVNVKASEPISAKVTITSKLKHKCHTDADALIIDGQAPEICMPPYYNDGKVFEYGVQAMRFAGAVKVLGNAVFDEDSIVISNQTEFTLLVSLATNFIDFKSMPVGDPIPKALKYFENAKPYNELLKEHTDDFSSLFNRVDVDFGSERAEVPTDKRLKQFKKGADDNNLIALLFQYGRYLTISCSRQGTRAMTLQGIFNPHLRAPWSSSYTTNINTEMNYWCTDICNLSECFEPFFEQAKNMCINGEVTAKDYYNCNGSCAHHNSDIWGASYPAGDPLGKTNSESYAFWQSSLPWMLNEAFEHYRYTRDEKLFEEMKPYFKKVLDFYNDYLIEHDGKLVTCPSSSPENTYNDNGVRGCLTYMPTMDIGILQEFFQNCREFGFDTPEIPDIPIGSDGRINEWAKEYAETEVTHRHVSHLYCVYPSAVEQSDEVREAAKKSLLKRGFDGTGWALGWKVCLWARLDEAENALKLIKNQLRPINPRGIKRPGGGSYPNMFDAHPPFQIDGNFGVAAGIAEMLVRGAIPKEWSGYAKGIKRKDGTELNIKFDKGKIYE